MSLQEELFRSVVESTNKALLSSGTINAGAANARRLRNGTGKVELRTRVESNEAELVLVPTDGSEVLRLATTRL